MKKKIRIPKRLLDQNGRLNVPYNTPFELNGYWYKALKTNHCDDCVFHLNNYMCTYKIACLPSETTLPFRIRYVRCTPKGEQLGKRILKCTEPSQLLNHWFTYPHRLIRRTLYWKPRHHAPILIKNLTTIHIRHILDIFAKVDLDEVLEKDWVKILHNELEWRQKEKYKKYPLPCAAYGID